MVNVQFSGRHAGTRLDQDFTAYTGPCLWTNKHKELCPRGAGVWHRRVERRQTIFVDKQTQGTLPARCWCLASAGGKKTDHLCGQTNTRNFAREVLVFGIGGWKEDRPSLWTNKHKELCPRGAGVWHRRVERRQTIFVDKQTQGTLPARCWCLASAGGKKTDHLCGQTNTRNFAREVLVFGIGGWKEDRPSLWTNKHKELCPRGAGVWHRRVERRQTIFVDKQTQGTLPARCWCLASAGGKKTDHLCGQTNTRNFAREVLVFGIGGWKEDRPSLWTNKHKELCPRGAGVWHRRVERRQTIFVDKQTQGTLPARCWCLASAGGKKTDHLCGQTNTRNFAREVLVFGIGGWKEDRPSLWTNKHKELCPRGAGVWHRRVERRQTIFVDKQTQGTLPARCWCLASAGGKKTDHLCGQTNTRNFAREVLVFGIGGWKEDRPSLWTNKHKELCPRGAGVWHRRVERRQTIFVDKQTQGTLPARCWCLASAGGKKTDHLCGQTNTRNFAREVLVFGIGGWKEDRPSLWTNKHKELCPRGAGVWHRRVERRQTIFVDKQTQGTLPARCWCLASAGGKKTDHLCGQTNTRNFAREVLVFGIGGWKEDRPSLWTNKHKELCPRGAGVWHRRVERRQTIFVDKQTQGTLPARCWCLASAGGKKTDHLCGQTNTRNFAREVLVFGIGGWKEDRPSLWTNKHKELCPRGAGVWHRRVERRQTIFVDKQTQGTLPARCWCLASAGGKKTDHLCGQTNTRNFAREVLVFGIGGWKEDRPSLWTNKHKELCPRGAGVWHRRVERRQTIFVDKQTQGTLPARCWCLASAGGKKTDHLCGQTNTRNFAREVLVFGIGGWKEDRPSLWTNKHKELCPRGAGVWHRRVERRQTIFVDKQTQGTLPARCWCLASAGGKKTDHLCGQTNTRNFAREVLVFGIGVWKEDRPSLWTNKHKELCPRGAGVWHRRVERRQYVLCRSQTIDCLIE